MNKDLSIIVIIFILSHILSAFIFNFMEQNDISTRVNYESLKEYNFLKLFLENLKKNIAYFILVIILSLFGLGIFIYAGFSFISVIYGISMIYLVKVSSSDILYFILNLADNLIYFPILVFFTFNSVLLSKNIKKIKTNLKKIDIIVKKHISYSILSVSLVIVYSLLHSFWVYIILLFKN